MLGAPGVAIILDVLAGGSSDQPPPADGIPALAQVKMLIALQKELVARTVEIEKLRGKDGQFPAGTGEALEAYERLGDRVAAREEYAEALALYQKALTVAERTRHDINIDRMKKKVR